MNMLRGSSRASEHRSRGTVVLVVALALAAPLAAAAEPGRGELRRAGVTPGLLESARANPEQTFDVIVQGAPGRKSASVAAAVAAERGRGNGNARGVRREFSSIAGVAAELTGKQLERLAAREGIEAISLDAPMRAAYHNNQGWPYLTQVSSLWPTKQRKVQAPTIAIVDSGIDASRPDFGRRVVEQVDLTSLAPNSPGDGRGHGTFVASLAAGEAPGYAGAAPNAKIVSLDVLNDAGQGLVSDVIAAADWILANKDRYGIRVANFSLHATLPSSFRNDPLDKAVERLWFSGVVVVVSAGNYGAGKAGRVPYAPANDPFVITVGAMDDKSTSRLGDDDVPSWTAFGYTLDGFRKPEVGAPGRRLIAAVPTSSTMALERPGRVVAPGYMWMSGTSFAAPIVAGSAASILAFRPNWTPDQVKGALMQTTDRLYTPGAEAIGTGRIDPESTLYLSSPTNPNAALNRFLVPDPAGGPLPVFDASAWSDAAAGDSAWDSSAWSDSAWSDSAWSDSAWSDSAWSDSAWSDSAWSDSAWADSTWLD